MIDGNVLRSAGGDISASLSSSVERLLLVVGADCFHGSLSVTQAVAVKSDANSKRGAICWIGVGGKELLEKLEDANDTADKAYNGCHCERSFVYGTYVWVGAET